MPAFPMDTLVEYYIEALFDGYATSDEYRYSPTYLPAGIPHGTNTQYFTPPVSGFFSYVVRPYMSNFDVLKLTGTVPNINLEQQSDWVWQGIIDFGINTATNPTLALSGFSRYTGTNYWPTANTWADIYQTRTTIPMFNIMYPGETNALTMAGEHVGQYVFRFDEKKITYILHRCAFQDFNVWYADDQYFTESWSYDEGIKLTTNNFNDWPGTSYIPWPVEDFKSWPVGTNWAPGEVQGSAGWIINQAKIIWHLDNDKGCQLRNDHTTLPYIRPTQLTQTEGVGNFNFEYRCIDTNHYPTLYWAATNWGNTQLRARFRATEVPVNQSGLSFGKCHLSLYQRYNGPNSYYELRVEQTDLNQRQLRLYRKNGPGDPVFLTTLESWGGTIESWHDLDWIVWTAGGGQVSHEVIRDGGVRSYFENGGGLTTQTGAFGIDTTDADIQVDNVRGGWGQLQYFHSWYNPYYTNTVNRQQWRAKYCYINNDYARFRDPTPDDGAFLRSPLLPHGVSRIRFRHKDTGSSLYTYKFKVQWSNTGSDNDGDWTDIRSVGPVSGNWMTLNIWTNIPLNNIYVRVRVDPTSDYGFFLDEMSIRPSYSAPVPAMYENFSDGVADNWTNPGGWWYCTTNATNSTYSRPGYTETPLSFDIQTATYNDRDILSQDYVWKSRTSIVSRTQTRFITVSVPFQESGTNENTRTAYARVKHTGGKGSLVFDNIVFDSWHGKDVVSSNNQWRAWEAWLVDDGSGTNNYLELSQSRSYIENYTAGVQRVRSADQTNGIGVITFHTSRYSADSPPCVYEVQWVTDTNEPIWNVLRTYTNDSHALPSWKYHSVALETNETAYIQIVHTSPDFRARLLIDDFKITGYSARDEFNWVVYNGLVTHSQSNDIWLSGPINPVWTTGRDPIERSAYINHGSGTYADTPELMDKFQAHVQSSKMPRGIGEISFWYKKWENTPSLPATMSIKVAPSYTLPEVQWTEIATITNIVAGEWRYFRELFYDATNRFVRFYAGLAPSNRICIDDLLIMEPLGADLIVSDLVTDPAIPLDGEPVYIQANLGQYLLDVTVTNVELRYVVGTNNWAAWDPGTAINMSMVTNNPMAGTYTWRADTPIPGYAVDTTVQYYLFCEFDGRFADRGGSPKSYKTFVNPSHYEPTDYNELYGGTNSIPYYIVFSCLPGAVWINELNTTDGIGFLTTTYLNEFIELCGPNSVDIANWRIEIINQNAATVAVYQLASNASISNTTAEGYGFWVLGDSGVANTDLIFTNTVPGGAGGADQSMPEPVGGVKLVRSMGAVEYQVCYGEGLGHPPNLLDFEYIGDDPAFNPENMLEWWSGSLQRTGYVDTGTNWLHTNGSHTPGALNTNQYVPPPTGVVIITLTDMRLLGATIELDYTQVGSATPSAPWYSTNLVADSWAELTNYNGPTESSGTYTVTFDLPTNYPVYFYKIVNP